MARRNRSGGSRPASRWVAWSPAMAEVFGFSSFLDGWRAPAQVRVAPGRNRMNLSARFTNDRGRVMVARVRCARDCDGAWYVTLSELEQNWTLKIGGAA